MPLDPQCHDLVERYQAWRAAFPVPLLEHMRGKLPEISERTRRLVDRTEDREIAGPGGPISLRLYWARGAPEGMLLYFHGGGFITGGLGSVDGQCRVLASASGCLVASAAYRLAPEHPYPAGVEDGHAATLWALAESDRLGLNLAVGGESAGGTIATVACMIARDRGERMPAFQLLVYPGINLRLDTPERSALARAGYVLDPDFIDWLNSHYCRDPAQFGEPYCAPANAIDLSGMPPALVIAGEYDPLRFENRDYARRLQGAGVDTEFRLYPGMVHGFMGGFERIGTARSALAEAAAGLRAALAGG